MRGLSEFTLRKPTFKKPPFKKRRGDRDVETEIKRQNCRDRDVEEKIDVETGV